jgi:alpha-beta hydrolase superfamily lysophospholipase
MPTREPVVLAPDGASSARTMSLRSTDGTPLHASLFAGSRTKAGLLVVHGLQSHAGWLEASDTARELADVGICSLAYDRRGSGRSSGPTGHAESDGDFLMDLAAAHAALECEIGRTTPIHLLANCFGARAALAYAGEHPEAFASLILTSPATHMSRQASYGLGSKLRIALAPPTKVFATPLRDEYFVREGRWLDWIRRDPLALRSVSAGFLRSAARLTRRMWSAVPRISIPLLVVLARRDAIVDNDAICRSFLPRWRGPHRRIEYDAEHYVDFTDARCAFARDLERWLREPRP